MNDFSSSLYARSMRGFTLVEVMVALVIFAVLSVTLLTRLGDNIRAEHYLQQKALAEMIAQDKLANLRIKKDWSAITNKTESVSMADQEWTVKVEATDTKNENLRLVTVRVGPKAAFSAKENFIVTLTSFLGRY
ncbi:MAG TPA: type II secretion system minor pseudopilin GspI [Pseudomonadales bacterium]|nr:type II secretion system minor pseudopilin GspI [Pseudomonadales bacterium]